MLAILAISCNKKANPETETTDDSVDTTVYPVKIALLEKKRVPRNIEYTANLLPYEEVNFAPASPGRIEEINVEIGSRVKKGDVIARMDKTQLAQAYEQLQNARVNFERMDTLRKTNSVSEQQYDAVKTQYEVLKTSCDFLNRNTTLVSPINGIVTGKYFENGEMYSAAPNTAAGKAAIVTIMQINPLKAKINIPERFFPIIKKGMKVNVNVDIYRDKRFNGHIYRIYPTISPDTRTFSVELTIDNPGEILRPGMFARVSLDLGNSEAIIVPAIAVIKQEGTNERYILLAENKNTAKKIYVQIGDRYDDKLEIISNRIKVGDSLIVAGQERLLDGTKIKIVK